MKTLKKIILTLLVLLVAGACTVAYLFYGVRTSNPHSYATVGEIPAPRGYERIMVVDVAQNPKTGKKAFLLAEGNTPARDIHVLRNLEHPFRSPWFMLDEKHLLLFLIVSIAVCVILYGVRSAFDLYDSCRGNTAALPVTYKIITE